MKLRLILLFVFGLFGSIHCFSQELNCSVQINSSQVSASDKTVFENLQSAVYEFMNNRKWTNYEYQLEEKIECTILITVSSWDNIENFNATIQVQSRRPVFNSSYFTTLLNYQDRDFTFKYVSGQPLDYVDNAYSSNLSSVLAFYAYLIIGFDFDSYTEFGGTPFFEKAQSVITAAQNSPDKGWKAFENQKNRYWIIENLLNSSYDEFRKAMYMYHMQGMDIFTEDAQKARLAISDAMALLQQVYKEKPGLFIISLFMLAKSDELVNVFTPAPVVEKTKVVNILKSVDPANSAKYNKILTTN